MKNNIQTFEAIKFSFKPYRLASFAAETPDAKTTAEVVDKKTDVKNENLSDKKNLLKSGLLKAEEKVSEFEKRNVEKAGDEIFQKMLTDRKIDLKSELANAKKIIGEIKPTLENEENSKKNAETLAEINKLLN